MAFIVSTTGCGQESPLASTVTASAIFIHLFLHSLDFLTHKEPTKRQNTMPITVAAGPYMPGPAGDLDRLRLCAMTAPKNIPRTKTGASLSPSPLMINYFPGHPPARIKARPDNPIPMAFHKAFV